MSSLRTILRSSYMYRESVNRMKRGEQRVTVIGLSHGLDEWRFGQGRDTKESQSWITIRPTYVVFLQTHYPFTPTLDCIRGPVGYPRIHPDNEGPIKKSVPAPFEYLGTGTYRSKWVSPTKVITVSLQLHRSSSGLRVPLLLDLCQRREF